MSKKYNKTKNTVLNPTARAQSAFENSESNLNSRIKNIELNEQELNSLLANKNQFETEKSELTNTIATRERALSDLENKMLELQKSDPSNPEIANMQSIHTERKEELQLNYSRMHFLDKDINRLAPDVEKLSAKVEKQKTGLDTTKLENQEFKLDWKQKELVDNEETWKANQEKIAQLNAEKTSLKKEDTNIRKNINKLSGDELINSTNRLNEIEAKIEANKALVKDLRKENTNLKKEAIKINLSINEAQLEIGNLVRNVQEFELSKNEPELSKNEPELAVEEQVVESEELSTSDLWKQERLAKIKNQKDILPGNIAKLQEELNTLENAIGEASNKSTALSLTVNSLNAEINEKAAALEAAVNSKNLFENSSAFEERNTDLTEDELATLAEMDAEISKAQLELDAKKTELDMVNEKLSNELDAKTDLIAKRESVSNELTELKEFGISLEATEMALNMGAINPLISDAIKDQVITTLSASIQQRRHLEEQMKSAEVNSELEKELKEQLLAIDEQLNTRADELTSETNFERGHSVEDFEKLKAENYEILRNQVATANSIKESKSLIAKAQTFARDRFPNLTANFHKLKDKLSRKNKEQDITKNVVKVSEIKKVVTSDAYESAKDRRSVVELTIYLTEDNYEKLMENITNLELKELNKETINEINKLKNYNSPVDNLKREKEEKVESNVVKVVENTATKEIPKEQTLAM